MHIFVSYILVLISPLAYGDENEDQRILSLVIGKIKNQFEDKVDYQVKYENLFRELEQKFRIRELEFDNRIRELEQNIQIRELEQNIQIRELEQNIQIRELKQADRIRKLEQTMQKQTEDLKRDCTCSKKDYTNVEVNHELVLPNKNATLSKTPDMIVKDPIPNELNHEHNRRYKKNEDPERQGDSKRLLLDTDASNTVAFYAYMDTHEQNPGSHQTLIFDIAKTNVGSAYNTNSGLFTSPDHGIYVFTWTIIADYHGYVYTEIVINSVPFGSILTNSQEINDEHTVTGIIVAVVNQGDVVYIRTNPKGGIRGWILSQVLQRTSFSGWKIN